MATAAAAAAPLADAHHEELSFIRKYIFSTDHKIIGIQFLFASLAFLVLGGVLAILLRWQLGFPGEELPGVGTVAPKFYNSLVTMHGTFMVFFAVMPLLVGVYANYLIPLKIGAPDMAFPRLNMLSFWMFIQSGIVMTASLFVEGGAAGSGWTAYAPLSAVPQYTGASLGQQLWILSIVLFGASSLLGSVNYITTVINMRAPGMTLFRMPLSVWALFITAIIALLAIPIIAAAVIMLFFDLTLGTTFFLPADGGQPLLWQHLFWFFGHPEVYILILPAMGIISDVIANGSRKPVFGYHSMVLAIIAIAFLGWITWGHHMFQSGMNPLLGTSFMISTMAIAVPSAIKVFNWLGTMWRGNIRFHTPMLWAIGFVSLFTVGGLSGIFMASNAVDIFIHDTYFIVAHIHYVLFGGSLMAIFAAVYFWFPKMFGRMMSETWGKIHFVLTFIFYNLTFFPMHILGMAGHMRRIYDPTQYEFLQPYQPMNRFITISAILLFVVQLPFIVNFFWSLFRGKKADINPWQDNGLEWTVPSPPPHGNFAMTPTVYRGPYEFSVPGAEADYMPQSVPPSGSQ
ncbi:MAG: cbb3-type cytochrome c oxidase subunit I [Gemmatimonadota bacterium]|nr:MAG: cbb3-type cytochrome c oxidase subunit I [Gemmatimonadota bacterium]